MMASQNILIIQVLKAVELRKRSWCGRVSPYVALSVEGLERQATPVAQVQKDSVFCWDVEVKLSCGVTTTSKLSVEIFDKTWGWRDVLLCSGTSSVSEVLQGGVTKLSLFTASGVSDKHNEPAGILHVSARLETNTDNVLKDKVAAAEYHPWVWHETEPFENFYTICQPMGKGGYGKLDLVAELTGPAEYACKTISKRMLKTPSQFERMKLEVHSLYHLSRSPSIPVVQIQDVFENRAYVHIVMEYVQGGDLDHFLSTLGSRPSYSERDAAGIICHVLKAVELCHKHRVVHRDITPRNILLGHDNITYSTIKLADLGHSHFLHARKDRGPSVGDAGNNQPLEEDAGTPAYAAPERYSRSPEAYNKEVDIWSCGVLLHYLLSGMFPFEGKKGRELYELWRKTQEAKAKASMLNTGTSSTESSDGRTEPQQQGEGGTLQPMQPCTESSTMASWNTSANGESSGSLLEGPDTSIWAEEAAKWFPSQDGVEGGEASLQAPSLSWMSNLRATVKLSKQSKMQRARECPVPLDLESAPWDAISLAAKLCVRRMLEFDPQHRATASELLKDPWIQGEDVPLQSKPLPETVRRGITGCAATHVLMQKMLLHLAQLGCGDPLYTKLFAELDNDHDGRLSFEELKEALQRRGVSFPDNELDELMKAADQNGNGTIELAEFTRAAGEVSRISLEELTFQAFNRIDTDHNDIITVAELEQALQLTGHDHKEVHKMLAAADVNNDGTLDFNEFVALAHENPIVLDIALPTDFL